MRASNTPFLGAPPNWAPRNGANRAKGRRRSGRHSGPLRDLPRTVQGKLLAIWDGSPIYQGQPIKDILDFLQCAANRSQCGALARLRADLNPEEDIGNYRKRVEGKNRCCAELTDLRTELRWATERLRGNRQIIQACPLQCGHSV